MKVKTSRERHLGRLAALRKRMAVEDLDLILLVSQPSLNYMVGYTGSNGLLLVGPTKAEFVTDGRYTLQAKSEVKGASIAISTGDLIDYLPNLKGARGGRKKIGFENHRVSDVRSTKLRVTLPDAFFVGFRDFVSPLQEIKDASEIVLIEKAAAIADLGFLAALECIKPGVRERDVMAELEYTMQKAGSEKAAFDTIVASGPRSALPHGRASMRKIRKGDFVTMDFGATVDGYVSDITRTVIVGKPTARQKRVYDLVKRAQQSAVRRVRPGAACAKVDAAARDIIKRGGHGLQFSHGLGHGIGLEVHEGPSVNAKSKTILKTGMVITIEPGVYFPGWGGVRIEDDVVVGRSSGRVLTHSDRRLIVL